MISAAKHIIICSHGFGVKKDDRGLFPDSVSEIKDAEVIMFDYNSINNSNMLTVRPFSEQAKILETVLQETKRENLDAVIDIVCHSEGCIIVGLLKPEILLGVRQIIMLTPPFSLSSGASINRALRIDSHKTDINMKGISKLARSDGSVTFVPKEFWQEKDNTKPIEIYNKLSNISDITIINANQDKVLPKIDLNDLNKRVRIIDIDGDHGFTGENRKNIKELLRNLLS